MMVLSSTTQESQSQSQSQSRRQPQKQRQPRRQRQCALSVVLRQPQVVIVLVVVVVLALVVQNCWVVGFHHHHHHPSFFVGRNNNNKNHLKTHDRCFPSSSSRSSLAFVRGGGRHGGIFLNMFTGIVEEMGTVVSLEERDDMTLWDGTTGSGTELTIQGNVVLEGAYLGCSISVSGVCLTATHIDHETNQFKVGLAPETLRRTYLGSVKSGEMVNLERASEIGGRNSGHFVQGHVDCTGKVIHRWKDKDSLWFQIQLDDDDDNNLQENENNEDDNDEKKNNEDDTTTIKTNHNFFSYIVPKGFIAIDGTSLTVVDVNTNERWFTIMLVDYTQKKIILPSVKTIGTRVNIEVDVLGKYAETTVLTTLRPQMETLQSKVTALEQQVASLQQLVMEQQQQQQQQQQQPEEEK